MKIHKLITATLFCLLGVLVFFFTSCNHKSYEIDPAFSQYITAFTFGSVSPESYIQVELAQEMPAIELNAEVKENLFSFSPSIKGKTYWISNNTVRFIPDSGQLKPGKEYNAKFHLNKVMQVEKKFKIFKFFFRVSKQNYSLDVFPYSPISSSDLKWNRVETELTLANAASTDKIKEMFSVSNAPQARVSVTSVNNNTYRIAIDSLERDDKDQTYVLKVNGEPIGVKKTTKIELKIPRLSTDHFEVINVRVIRKSDPHIRITFSDPVSQTQDLQGLIIPTGVTNFTYQIDKNVLKIYPEIMPQGNFNLQINKGIKSSGDLYLDKTYVYQMNIEGDKPEIKFEKNGNILPNSDQLTLPFKAVNLWAVDVKVIKIYQNNILYYLQSNNLKDNSQNEIRRFGRLVMKKRILLDVDKSLDLSKWNNFNIDLAPLMKKDPGALYLIELSMKKDYSLYNCGGVSPKIPKDASMKRFSDETISDEDEGKWDVSSSDYYDSEDGWDDYNWEEKDDPCKASYYMSSERKAETIVTASNIGLIAKSGNDNRMTVVATDILSTEPISGAKVLVYNYQMQVIGKGNTDSNGFAEIDCGKNKPYIVTAKKEKDTGYLEVKDELSLSLSNFDVSGKEIQKGLKGYIYCERGIWRPGDTIHVTFILEDKEQKLPKGHPVTLEVYSPTRQFYQRQVKNDGQNGFYTFNVISSPSAQTGTWQAYIKVGGSTFYKSLNIETIKPNRLKVRLETDSIIDASKGRFSGTLKSQWLQGAPASNLKAYVEISLSKADNPFKGFTGYEFNNPMSRFENNKYKVFEGNLNGSGVAAVNSNIPTAENAPGMLRGNILSRVFETGGDMSFYSQTVYYSPYSVYVGVKSPEAAMGNMLETDKPLAFDLVTVNAHGKKVIRTNIEYKIYKLEWSWWWSKTDDNLGSYVNNTAVHPLSQGVVNTPNGTAKIRFQVNYPDWGRYLLIAKDPAGHVSGTIFYVDWPSWRGRSNKTDPNGLTMLSFSTDKPGYKVGEKATVIIPKSSAGRVLISIENGSRIIQREWIKTSSKEDTKYTFKVTDEMNPNFYVFATLLQPYTQKDNDLPIRMYGVVNVNVENANSKLIPVISMPNELRPEKEFTLSVSEKTKKPMTYTVAIVDEGLLDITAFKTPNAWNEFYTREALGIRTWDLFDRILGANTGKFGPLLSIGGDEELKASSDKVNRFKPVVKFLGPFTIKGGETKSLKIKLPSYVGSVRVMVVAGGNGAYGSTEKTVAVRNALMTLSTLPRVMGPNEEVLLPINVFAMDKKVKNVRVSIQTKGLLKPLDGVTKSLTFAKTGDQVIFFRLKTGSVIGTEQVKIIAAGGGESSTETINIGIRNPNPPVILTQAQLINPSTTATLKINTDGVNPHDWAKLEISRLPSINFNRNITYLLEYPHGCSEQLCSQGFPLLYINDLTTLTDAEKKQTSDKVAQVILMLLSRQLPNGGFMYWPGDSYATEWITTYVGHFLTEAKNKGYEVPENVLSRWVQFQQKLARNWTPTNTYQSYYGYTMTELQQAYRLYSLSLSGNAELGAMNRMRELKNLSIQSIWQLAAAYALAGKKDVANSMVFNTTDQIPYYSFNNDTYGTPSRDQAMIMKTYLLLGKTEKALGLAQNISQALSSDYISTQTAAFGLMAMSQLAAKMGKGNIDANWSMNGKKMQTILTPQPLYQVNIKPTQSLSVNVTNKGKGKIYARLTTRTQPIVDKLPATQGSFKLTINYRDKNGKEIDVKSLKQGTEFTAHVMVANNPSQAFTDLALVQIFPSGWEILNERIFNPEGNSSAGFTYRDIRDDRVLTYFNLSAGETTTFQVKLQAAYRGTYYLPAVSCQAMYEPREQARTTGKWVSVVE